MSNENSKLNKNFTLKFNIKFFIPQKTKLNLSINFKFNINIIGGFMNFGICGYGNLGKAVERQICLQKQDNLVGIFSRRKVKSEFSIPVYNYSDAKNFKDKIDVMIMCGGSQEDLLWQSPEMLENFNIIDTFDTHAKIDEHKQALEKVAEKSGKTAIYSCGWDPGIFSVIRVLASNIFEAQPQTFWGEGVSQGHSEALRNIKGIKDAIQFTIPNLEFVNQCRKDPSIFVEENKKHLRKCYICLDGTRPFKEICNEINNTEHYFKGQETNIIECGENEIAELKKKMFHRGEIFAGDEQTNMNFGVKMESNPNFTAKIVLAYAHAITKLPPKVYSVLDVPVGCVGSLNNFQHLI